MAAQESAPRDDRGGELTLAHLGETAFLLKNREVLLGLRKSAYGVFNWFSLETMPFYDLLGSWNIFGKLRVLNLDPVAVAARAGIFYITLDEPLPEVEQSSSYRVYLGGVVSAKLSDTMLYHFNVNNTSLHGDIMTQNKKLFNIENDLEYKMNERRSVIGAVGYNVSTKKISFGGSHLWKWSTFHLQLGLTFRAGGIPNGVHINMLPVFDLGLRF